MRGPIPGGSCAAATPENADRSADHPNPRRPRDESAEIPWPDRLFPATESLSFCLPSARTSGQCGLPVRVFLSGEPLEEAVPALRSAASSTLRGLLLNCATPEAMEEVYPRFVPLADGLPHGLYAHLGQPEETTGWKFLPHDEPQHYADWMARYLDRGARLIGGCCGTTPTHIAALTRLLPPTR